VQYRLAVVVGNPLPKTAVAAPFFNDFPEMFPVVHIFLRFRKNKRLPLDTGIHKAGFNIRIKDDKNNQQGYDADHHSGAHFTPIFDQIRNKTVQRQGNGPHPFLGNHQEGPEKVVPGPHGFYHQEGNDMGMDHGDDDGPENPEFPCAVNAARFDVGLGYGFHGGPEQEGSEGRHERRNHEARVGIHQAQLRHDQKEGDRSHLGGYHQHSKKQIINNFLSGEFEFRKTIGGGKGEDEARRYGNQHHNEGIDNGPVQGEAILGDRIPQKYIFNIGKIEKRIGNYPMEHIPVGHINDFRIQFQGGKEDHDKGDYDKNKKKHEQRKGDDPAKNIFLHTRPPNIPQPV
jgi:hypothetical protein